MKTTVPRRKVSPIKEFFSFDQDVIKYISMHWLGGSLLIYATLVPVFMSKLGINIVTAGIIFSLAGLIDALLTFLLSKKFDKISPNIGMALDWLTESLPALVYGFASTGFHFALAAVTQRVTNVLNPTYRMYENEIFEEKKRSLIYLYHIITPQIFTIILYPLVGYLLTYVFPTTLAFRVIFWICGAGYLFVSLIPIKSLKWVQPVEIPNQSVGSFGFSRELYLCAMAQILVLLGICLIPGFVVSYYILEQMNGTVMDIMLLEALGGLVVLVTGLLTKNLGNLFSEAQIARYGILFFVIYAGIMVFAKSLSLVLVATIFFSIGNTIWFPNHYSLIMQYVPKEKRGQFFASISSLSKLLGILTPVVAGFLVNRVGFYSPFALALVAFGLCTLIYQRLVTDLTKNPVE